MVQSYQNWCRIDKKQGVSSLMSQIMKNDPFFVVHNGYNLQGIVNNYINANKAVHCFQTFSSASCKMLVQTILQDSVLQYSRIKPRKKGKKMHTPYADTDVLHTICVDSVFRSGLTKGTCNQGRTNFACSVVSLESCLQLTKITRDFA